MNNNNYYSFLEEITEFPTIKSTKGLFDLPKNGDTNSEPEIIYTNNINLLKNNDVVPLKCTTRPVYSETCNSQSNEILTMISSSFNNCGTTMAINFSFIFSLLSTILFIILISLLIINVLTDMRCKTCKMDKIIIDNVQSPQSSSVIDYDIRQQTGIPSSDAIIKNVTIKFKGSDLKEL